MPNKLLLIFAIILLFTLTLVIVSSTTDQSNMIPGKNHVMFNLTEPFYVKDLIKWNPQISVVSFSKENKTIGFVNLYNGVGDDFIIENNQEYEIILSKNIYLVLPPGTQYINLEV